MTATGLFKVCLILGVVGVNLAVPADVDPSKNRSKYKYGYVISHKEGTTQAHLESREGNLALGRYYVNLPDGNGQKVTYFADDLGFHTGVTYSSRTGKGSSKTHIAMGHKAFAAFGNSDAPQIRAVSTFAPQFGKKISKLGVSSIVGKPASLPKLNYTPVPGGFYLTHESVDVSNYTTEHPNYALGLTPDTYSTFEGRKHSEGVFQSKANTQSFYPTSENVKNEIKQLHIQSTTPSIKTYTSVSQQPISGNSEATKKFSTQGQRVKISSFVTNSDAPSYSSQKSVEKTNFGEIDAQIISEVQKHAEQIILKDLHKDRKVAVQNEFSKFTQEPQLTTVTMQPIVVTDGGEIIVSSTALPEGKKSGKDFQSGSINAVRITEKNTNDQRLEDSGYFRVSLSPSLTSSINVSPAPQQLIDVKSTDRNSDSDNSTLCDSNLCGKDSGDRSLSAGAPYVLKSIKEVDHPDSQVSGSGRNKITHNFYPKNEIADERHYVTTIDVQKGISLDVQQNEDGSIQLAESFPFNKLKSYQNQFYRPTPQPILSNQISVTPAVFVSDSNPNIYNPPPPPPSQQTYVLNTVTAAPGVFDATPNQNLAVLQGFNDVSPNPVQYSSEVQDRIGINRPLYENQLTPTVAPVALTSPAQAVQAAADVRKVQQSIAILRQQILSDIDAHHEEEQRKQNIVDEERRQYFENLKKVEALKGQSSFSYGVDVSSQSESATVSPPQESSVAPQPQYVETPQSQYVETPQTQYVETPQTQYVEAPQTQYVETPQTTSYQTEIKNFDNHIPVVYTNVQPTASPQLYSKQVIAYNLQNFQTPSAGKQLNLYSPQNVQNVNVYPEGTPQQTVPVYADNNLQQAVSAYASNLQRTAPVYADDNVRQTVTAYASNEQQAVPAYAAGVQQTISTYAGNAPQPVPAYASGIQQAVSTFNTNNNQHAGAAYGDNNIQQTEPAYATQKIELNNYPQQAAVDTLQSRYAVSQATQAEEKAPHLQTIGVLNSVPVGVVPQATVPQNQVPEVGKTLLFNPAVPFDYSRLLQAKQPISLSQYPVRSETPIAFSGVYSVPQSLVQLSQAYKLLPYPDFSHKQYHSTLTQRPFNKLRIQPLKPSPPSEESQREAVQSLLSQPQYHPTYIYPGLPYNNRLQLRHVRKNQISNSDQVASQSLTRRGKSLKNLKIEYGFKPPLRPSVEFSEEVKPSIYGPSVPLQ